MTFWDQVDSAIRTAAPDYLLAGSRGSIDLSRGEVRIDWPADFLASLPGPGGADLRYQDPRGSATLRSTYLAHLEGPRPNGLKADNVLVTAGAKHALWLAFAAKVRAGDRVLLPRPGWAPYQVWTLTFGALPLFYDPRDIHAEALLSVLEARRCEHVVINSPHNPTGTEYDQATIDRIAAAAAGAGVTVISDEVYRELGRERASFIPHVDADGSILVADSVSKTAAAAGLRVGFLVGAGEAIHAALAVRATIDSCPAEPSQAISAFLLSQDAAWFRQRVQQVAKANVAALAAVLRDRGITVESSGGLYVWAETVGGADCIELAPDVLVGGVSGRSFGLDGYVRLCPVDTDERITALLEIDRPGLAVGQ